MQTYMLKIAENNAKAKALVTNSIRERILIA